MSGDVSVLYSIRKEDCIPQFVVFISAVLVMFSDIPIVFEEIVIVNLYH